MMFKHFCVELKSICNGIQFGQTCVLAIITQSAQRRDSTNLGENIDFICIDLNTNINTFIERSYIVFNI